MVLEAHLQTSHHFRLLEANWFCPEAAPCYEHGVGLEKGDHENNKGLGPSLFMLWRILYELWDSWPERTHCSVSNRVNFQSLLEKIRLIGLIGPSNTSNSKTYTTEIRSKNCFLLPGMWRTHVMALVLQTQPRPEESWTRFKKRHHGKV